MDGTFVMAASSLVLSAVSVAWQVTSHFLSGGRVRCHLSVGVSGRVTFTDGPSYSLSSSPADADRPYDAYGSHDREQYPYDVLIVQAFNAGRAPVTVSWANAHFGRGLDWGIGTVPLGFSMTGSYYLLAPGETREWVMPVWPAVDRFRELHPDKPVILRASVGLNGGRRCVTATNNALTIPEGVRSLIPGAPPQEP
ncbi:hypothetical protein [Streptomyces sp. CRN 30]|uniref:hypothetical protein n=1 Tax=Streptomyces sp. CRN 30 TaxID=3075613 RepID=UPI002A7F51E2|nr:hypothetical protein [Streptomyces sp. CRN 30]